MPRLLHFLRGINAEHFVKKPEGLTRVVVYFHFVTTAKGENGRHVAGIRPDCIFDFATEAERFFVMFSAELHQGQDLFVGKELRMVPYACVNNFRTVSPRHGPRLRFQHAPNACRDEDRRKEQAKKAMPPLCSFRRKDKVRSPRGKTD